MVDAIALIDALKNDISLSTEDIEGMHHDEDMQKNMIRGTASAEGCGGCNEDRPARYTLKEARGQHDELCKPPENKGLAEGATDRQAEGPDVGLLCDSTVKKNCILSDSQGVIHSTSACYTQRKEEAPPVSGATIESTVRLLDQFNSAAHQLRITIGPTLGDGCLAPPLKHRVSFVDGFAIRQHLPSSSSTACCFCYTQQHWEAPPVFSCPHLIPLLNHFEPDASAAASFTNNIKAGIFIDFSGILEPEPAEKSWCESCGAIGFVLYQPRALHSRPGCTPSNRIPGFCRVLCQPVGQLNVHLGVGVEAASFGWGIAVFSM